MHLYKQPVEQNIGIRSAKGHRESILRVSNKHPLLVRFAGSNLRKMISERALDRLVGDFRKPDPPLLATLRGLSVVDTGLTSLSSPSAGLPC